MAGRQNHLAEYPRKVLCEFVDSTRRKRECNNANAKLSEADPRDSAEGSIDPLGVYSIADAMAVKMIPGVRERQRHPRFLTTVALSISLCQDFGEDVVATE